MSEAHHMPRLLRPILSLPGLGVRAAIALERHARRKGLLPVVHTVAPSVSVGSPARQTRGKLLLSAWVLGYAASRGLGALAAMDGYVPADPEHPSLLVEASTPADAKLAEAVLLARYAPRAAVLAAKSLGLAVRDNEGRYRPGLILWHDGLHRSEVARDLDLAVLSLDDVGHDYNQVLPAGPWREGAGALARADAFVIYAEDNDYRLREKQIERRLARFGKPVYHLSYDIWRMWSADSGEEVADLGGEGFVLVAGEGEAAQAEAALERRLGKRPRMRVIFHESHHFGENDRQAIRHEAKRMRCPHVVATPREALKLGHVQGAGLYSFDPELRFARGPGADQDFLEFFDTAFKRVSETVLTRKLYA